MDALDVRRAQRRAALIGLLSGAVGGLLFGVGYWFLWGCTRCAKDQSPYAVLGFCVLVGAVMGARMRAD